MQWSKEKTEKNVGIYQYLFEHKASSDTVNYWSSLWICVHKRHQHVLQIIILYIAKENQDKKFQLLNLIKKILKHIIRTILTNYVV